MLSTGRVYDIDGYQRPSHRTGLEYRHAPLSEGYVELGYPVKRETSVPDLEPKPAPTHRKRVPVACERCRKRKIKCSGDQGDGRGCDNCKSAGWDGCQFLRVRSELLQYHPTISAGRGWHNAHYHPYSRSQRNVHHLQNSPTFVSSNGMPYTTWHNEIDYSSLTNGSSGVAWNSQNYVSPYSVYENEAVSPYTTQPPSYMLPDPDHTINNGTSSMGSLSRSQQTSSWPDQIGNTNLIPQSSQYFRSAYSMNNGPPAKPYALIPLSTSFQTDRSVPNSTLHSAISAVPSSIDDRSPISAASHRSTHTWNTDTTTSTGNLSSQTSCGDTHDLSGSRHLTVSEDQAALYPYVAQRDSPQINIAAASLPIAREISEPQTLLHLSDTLRSNQGMVFSESELSDFHSGISKENFRTTSPSLYGCASRNRNAYYEVMPKRPMSDNATYRWHSVSTSSSTPGDVLLGEQRPQDQHATALSQYPVTGGPVPQLINTSTY